MRRSDHSTSEHVIRDERKKKEKKFHPISTTQSNIKSTIFAATTSLVAVSTDAKLLDPVSMTVCPCAPACVYRTSVPRSKGPCSTSQPGARECPLLRVFSDARSHLGQGTGGSSKQAVLQRTDATRFHSRHLDGAAYVCAYHIEVGFRKDGSLHRIPLALLSAWEARSLTQRHKEGKAMRRTTCLDERGIRDKRELDFPLGVPRARN